MTLIKGKDWIKGCKNKALLVQYLSCKSLSEIWNLDFSIHELECAYLRMQLGEPITKISGFTKFYNRFFITSPHVLDPRPETELLVDLANKYILPNSKILDLGCGSGCIGITLSLEHSIDIDLSDISHSALSIAKVNGSRLNAKCNFFESNWCADLNDFYDIIICNPPYISTGYDNPIELCYDPYIALFGGSDGFQSHKSAFLSAISKIKHNGIIIWEIGFKQEEQFSEFVHDLGYRIKFYSDFNNINRAAIVRFN